ncbi:hypothetical protein HHK36_029756 [Tetracentron sinense]|uniref:Glutaredoxin domain-containing protein n=1 Tax=Tetracentron sinense TaxID=13715 RepID=A0A835CZX0_TETSI|nr:hypothetical protein HHK36_029756 [Tetracentron sinense]
MGCASSKQSRSQRCRHCQSPYSPVPRSYSMQLHHPAQSIEDSYHVVALNSTTLGSLNLNSSNQIHHGNNSHKVDTSNQNHPGNTPIDDDDMKNSNRETNNVKEFSLGIIEAKTWSNMINDKIPKSIPKTPTRTPPGEPETINTWELMEGLEDYSPILLPNLVGRSFSFHFIPDSTSLHYPNPKVEEKENDTASPKPLWLQMADNDSTMPKSIICDLDLEFMSSFRKALEEPSPTKIGSLENEKVIKASKCPPNGEKRVVIYFTSLRGVRKTYEECCQVRVILKGLGVRIDERDVSMHYGFREELKELLGDDFNGGLPKVFVKGRCIGGAEEVRKMHEDGELEKIVHGCEGGNGVCEACGDIRFVPCERCSGSCKIYCDGDEEGEEGDYGFQRCPDCNENGILRCPTRSIES